MDALVSEVNSLRQQFRDVATVHSQLLTQQNECTAVLKVLSTFGKRVISFAQELQILEPDAKIYKSTGPVLTTQSKDDAISTITKRIEYISNEMLVNRCCVFIFCSNDKAKVMSTLQSSIEEKCKARSIIPLEALLGMKVQLLLPSQGLDNNVGVLLSCQYSFVLAVGVFDDINVVVVVRWTAVVLSVNNLVNALSVVTVVKRLANLTAALVLAQFESVLHEGVGAVKVPVDQAVLQTGTTEQGYVNDFALVTTHDEFLVGVNDRDHFTSNGSHWGLFTDTSDLELVLGILNRKTEEDVHTIFYLLQVGNWLEDTVVEATAQLDDVLGPLEDNGILTGDVHITSCNPCSISDGQSSSSRTRQHRELVLGDFDVKLIVDVDDVGLRRCAYQSLLECVPTPLLLISPLRVFIFPLVSSSDNTDAAPGSQRSI
ncbi:prefoldin subunit 6, putative [Babesia ovis]|uniref:Prefoldin subunit 6, putative n=1 Tax=Babesia ovis TaxID=5869 RepID=A0A9W5T9S2_BABOV|nr:prefoldin subunit 6, putative [Babesia ovis]